MPVTSAVTTLNTGGVGTAGAYLREVKSERCEPADLLVVAVGAAGVVASDETLDSVLGVSPAEVDAAAQLSGKAGQVTSAVAKLGDAVLRVLFAGVAKGRDVRLLVPPGASGADDAISRAAAVAAAVALARDLATTPSVRRRPRWLAEAATEVAASAGLEVAV